MPFDLRKFAKALIQGDESKITGFEASEDLAKKMISGEINIDGLKVFGIYVGKTDNLESVLKGMSSAVSCSFDVPRGVTYMADLIYVLRHKKWIWEFLTLGNVTNSG